MATSADRAILSSVFNPSQLPDKGDDEQDNLSDEEDTNLSASVGESKALEIFGVQAAEDGQLDKALQLFGLAISAAPRRPSPYNNRAQAWRLKGDTAAALEDLNNAINLSEGRGRSCSQAYCQRALISKLQGKEEQSKADFQKAAGLGSPFAKNILVQMNPYAALCNRMLTEMIGKLQQGNTS